MNPVLILTRNNLSLSKRCVESVRSQDIPALAEIVDNGSTDGTVEWAIRDTLLLDASPSNAGVSAGWNRGLSQLFCYGGIQYVLVVGNDTVLPTWFYRELLSYDVPFVTGVAVDSMAQLVQPSSHKPALTDNPDFSAFLIRRSCWETVGPFDEGMKHYSSDQDFHIRAHRRGVRLCKASVEYYHERSSTIRLASPEERAEIESQANKDRAYLKEKWGVSAGGPDYEALFRPEMFGCERTLSSVTAPAQG